MTLRQSGCRSCSLHRAACRARSRWGTAVEGTGSGIVDSETVDSGTAGYSTAQFRGRLIPEKHIKLNHSFLILFIRFRKLFMF